MNPLTNYAATTAAIALWYASLAEPRPTVFTCAEITQGTGLHMSQLRFPLVSSGWDRRTVSFVRDGKRTIRVLYAPPGYKVPPAPRGRPRFCLDDYIAVNIL